MLQSKSRLVLNKLSQGCRYLHNSGIPIFVFGGKNMETTEQVVEEKLEKVVKTEPLGDVIKQMEGNKDDKGGS